MVKSKIVKRIVYEENRDMDTADINGESTVYEINIVKFHLRVNIILGKVNDMYSDDSVLFFNIYLLNFEDSVDSKIGIFEINKKDYDAFKSSEDMSYANVEVSKSSKRKRKLPPRSFAEALVSRCCTSIGEYKTLSAVAEFMTPASCATSHSILYFVTTAPPSSGDLSKSTRIDVSDSSVKWTKTGGFGCVRGVSKRGLGNAASTEYP